MFEGDSKVVSIKIVQTDPFKKEVITSSIDTNQNQEIGETKESNPKLLINETIVKEYKEIQEVKEINEQKKQEIKKRENVELLNIKQILLEDLKEEILTLKKSIKESIKKKVKKKKICLTAFFLKRKILMIYKMKFLIILKNQIFGILKMIN